jgi:hypothetical protein
MSRKLLISLGVVGAIVIAGVASAGIMASNSCGYDEKTGNYLFEGKQYAYGTMDSAMNCALQGILPDVVASRLGVWGSAETKEEAEQINLMNELKKEEQKRPKE